MDSNLDIVIPELRHKEPVTDHTPTFDEVRDWYASGAWLRTKRAGNKQFHSKVCDELFHAEFDRWWSGVRSEHDSALTAIARVNAFADELESDGEGGQLEAVTRAIAAEIRNALSPVDPAD